MAAPGGTGGDRQGVRQVALVGVETLGRSVGQVGEPMPHNDSRVIVLAQERGDGGRRGQAEQASEAVLSLRHTLR